LLNSKQPDLIVPVGAPATQFWWRHRGSLFPSTPVVIAGIESRLLKTLALTPNDVAVAIQLDMTLGPTTALQLLPDTTNMVIVLGDSMLERFWVAQCQRAFSPYTNLIHFTWLNKLPLNEMCSRVASLPPRSVVGFGTVWVDAAGVPYEQMKALDQICAVTKAPVFGVLEEQLGHGIVGGQLFPSQTIGHEAARLAAQVLRGESGAKMPPPIIEAGPPTFDWRELKRWGINERLLPGGSVVRFRDPSPWQRYRWYLLGIAVIMLAQAATIVGLVVQRTRRHRAEAAAYELSGRLISGQEEERRRIARDLHDDLNQRLALLSVELDLAGHDGAKPGLVSRLEQMAVQVKDLSSDVHRLSTRLHPAKLDQLGLVVAARTLCKELSSQSDVRIEFTHEKVPRQLPTDIALCIYRVLQEALGNAVRHGKATQVRADLRVTANHLQLSVADNGIGFDPQDARNNDGLGLLSMRERARLVQGVLAIQAACERGTRVELKVPVTIGPVGMKEGL
jgi:signal transduction histidine kinase